MEEILKDLNEAVGVHGSFVCSEEGKVLAQIVPEAWPSPQVALAARVATQTFQALRSAGQRANEIDLIFAEGRLLMKSLRGGILVIYCARNVNLPLLNLSTSTAIKKLGTEIRTTAPARRKSAPILPPPIVPESPSVKREPLAMPSELAVADQQARQLIESARGRGLTLRALGTIGNYWHCRTARAWLTPPTATPQVIELAGLAKDWVALTGLFREAGFEINARFAAFYGSQRAIFEKSASTLHVQLFLDNYDMYHKFSLTPHLADEALTLPVTWLFLARLQAVEMPEHEFRELSALCLDHDLSLGAEHEKIDGAYITELCADDWGWYKTAMLNLEKLAIGTNWLETSEQRALGEWVQRLKQSIDAAPKSLRWQMRARLGESTRWYHIPPQPGQNARPDLAIG